MPSTGSRADPKGRVWESALNNNIVATYNVLEASKLAGVGRIGAASSIVVSQGHRETGDWSDELYRELGSSELEPIRACMVRYFCWDKRGLTDMSVWIPSA